jgi:hypothetical protein
MELLIQTRSAIFLELSNANTTYPYFYTSSISKILKQQRKLLTFA